MTDKKLSQLAPGTSIADADLFYSAKSIGGGGFTQVSQSGAALAAYTRDQLFTPLLRGTVPASGGGSTNFLRADGTWAVPPGGGGSGLTPIANNSVLGNISGGPAIPTALNQAQLTALVNLFSASLPGVVPASGGGTTNFLRADGSWAAPPGGAPGGSNGQIQFNNSGVFGGDANLLWAASSGLTDKLHSAFGNFALIDQPTFAPGDTGGGGHAFTSPPGTFLAPLVSNEFFSGDLHPFVNGVDGFACYTGFRHTGGSSASFTTGADIEGTVNTDSTGAIDEFEGIFTVNFNYGSGNITSFNGVTSILEQRGSGSFSSERAMQFQLRHRAGTNTNQTVGVIGTCNQFGGQTNNLYGFYVAAGLTGGTNIGGITTVFIDIPVCTTGTAPYVAQLRVRDATASTGGVTGTGPLAKLNVWSDGAASNNWFEGTIFTGTAQAGGTYAANVNGAVYEFVHSAYGGI